MLITQFDLLLYTFFFFSFPIIWHFLKRPKILLLVFTFKAVIFLFTTYITELYIGVGDVYNYFNDTKLLVEIAKNDFNSYFKILFKDFSSYDDFIVSLLESKQVSTNSNSTFFVSKIASIIGLLTGAHFLTIGIFFNFLSIEGLFKIYRSFQNLGCHFSTSLKYTYFFLPSLLVWTNGMLKEPIMLFGLGLLCYSVSIIARGRKKLYGLIMFFIGAYLVAAVKVYVLVLLLFSFIFSFSIIYSLTRSSMIKRLSSFIGLLALIISITLISNILFSETSNLDLQRLSFEVLKEQIEYQAGTKFQVEGNSNLESQPIDFSITGIIKDLPFTIFKGLYRPFITDLFSLGFIVFGIENMFLLFLIIYSLWKRKSGSKLRFKNIKRNIILGCISIYVILFSFFLGISINNMGTLLRYKVPILPFYICLCVFLINKQNRNYVRN